MVKVILANAMDLGRRWGFGSSYSRVLRATDYSLYSSSTCPNAAGDLCRDELCVGVLGLGAIGTIFFTRLGLLATNFKAKNETSTLQVKAFVKREQFDSWTSKEKLELSLIGQRKEMLEFQIHSDEKVATTSGLNVRVCTLEAVAEDKDGKNKLDVLLVAVKAYDSARVIREFRERKGHLLKHDALCVLLQNGLGEEPQEDNEGESRDQWQFACGVTFVGGRVVQFGEVVTSGLDVGKTYLAPLNMLRVKKEDHSSRDDMLLQKKRNDKIEMLLRVFLAAGMHCEVLGADEMQAMLWRKLIVNAAINPIASILNTSNRSVASSEGSRRCVTLVVQEALEVANREKMLLNCSQNELVEDILTLARNTGDNVCSMLADLRRGSRTEIDTITGRIVAGGKRHGVPTPTNELLLSLIKALEDERTRKDCAAAVVDSD
ncbi:unnamed protein product [Peronospora belbahrii]|uniref:2-dehydropantoate 2-reductase n=1 Tax=Peronospora belbahrii TaxID=622444 RepID=A0ABN8D9H4_9STRA|nr:unnamed protein product [Peronospora belbahrii]